MADVEQMKKIIPFVTREITFGQNVCELMFVSMYLFWILGSRLILSNNQCKATLWVLDTCLIVEIRPFIIILITASIVLKNAEPRTKQRRLHDRRNEINITQQDCG